MINVTFQEISDRIRKYLEDRDWDSNPSQSLAISVALEAAELLEHYQWTDKPVGDKDAIAAELADVFIYAFQIAQNENIDIPQAIINKLEKAAKKYPAEDFKGKDSAEQQKAWIENKLKHQKQGL